MTDPRAQASATDTRPAAALPLLIVRLQRPPAPIAQRFGEQGAWFQQVVAADIPTWVVDPSEGDALPPPHAVRGALLSGSWAMVTERAPWSESTAQWVRSAFAQGLPLFGVCYGHQLMAHALGGEVGYHPGGRELGCYPVHVRAEARHDPLFGVLPTQFPAFLSHQQSVLRLPPGAQVLARSAHDAHQIVRYGPNAVSTQFHPEFTAELLHGCLDVAEPRLRAEGRNLDAMRARVQPTPEARSLLTQFVAGLAAAPVLARAA